MIFVSISFRLWNSAIFSFSNLYLGKGSTTIKWHIKNLPMLNLRTWFLYLLYGLEYLSIWYSLTKPYNRGCLYFFDKYAWNGSVHLFGLCMINYFYQWSTDNYFNDYYFITCTCHVVTFLNIFVRKVLLIYFTYYEYYFVAPQVSRTQSHKKLGLQAVLP